MKLNNLLNKPIILSFLLFLFSFVFFLITSFSHISFYIEGILIPFAIALLLGLYQEKLNITLDKIKKIKISVYYSAIYIILFIPISTFLSCVGAKHLIFPFVTALIFTGIYLTFGIALYLGLLLGCEISKSDEIKTIKKFKLIHFLLIVFFIVLTLFTAKFGKIVVDALTAPVTEVLQDNYNGLLFDFFNIDQQVEKIEHALNSKINNKDKMEELRHNTRKTIVDNYALKDILPKHIEYITSLALKSKEIATLSNSI